MQAVVIDDKNPRIIYSTGWYSADGVHATDYNQTISISGDPSAGFSFKFNGTSISVYGSIPPNNTAMSMYTLDTSTPATFTSPNNTGPYKSGQLLYQSPALSDGEHTLSVGTPDTVIGDASTQFYFDYLTYASSAGNGTTPTSAVSTSGSGHSKASTVVPAVLVPCLVLIAALGAMRYWFKRRRRAAPTITPLMQETGYLTETSRSPPPQRRPVH
ncbi:hypothetical protein PHLGIDRAFT_314441 [Phlebiopsis gigantea 11061_1 CR5-6]|uniref:Uncharacterized protein n=1 Tax=Phlebiopsis gigantea (strain 11061_1 CR5-6) TaxID=745531 RepID=A0A0C3PAY1_PHLG1|nr:hypothetical protein PHLGIDRAFT_314441 [Phlebiopsis gigantea 11061_1 CR5-6]